MTNIDYYCCDSLVPDEQPAKEIHCKVNPSKRNEIRGGKHLALCDSEENGLIIGLDMLILYFNSDNKHVSIGITGDHQLTGNMLCTGCTVA